MRDTSLVYPIDAQGRVLLGRKKRGMGVNKWNGFGGKLEPWETLRQCAVRELWEESGLTVRPEDLELVGDIYFDQPSDGNWSHVGMVYFVRRWQGQVRATEEMEPRWFAVKDLPYEEMWEADKRWLPLLLQGKQLRGTVQFDEDCNHVIHDVYAEVHLDPGK